MRYPQAIWRVLESPLFLVIWLVVYLCVGFWIAYRWHASIWLKILATIFLLALCPDWDMIRDAFRRKR
jgi:hypothetical protein